MQKVGQDFRSVEPKYIGPELKVTKDGKWEDIWGTMYEWRDFGDGLYDRTVFLPFAEIEDVKQLKDCRFPTADWYDYSDIAEQCQKYERYAIYTANHSHMDFINGIALARGIEQVLVDIALEDPVLLYIAQKRFEFAYEKIRRTLEAANGAIDAVYVADDLGTQTGPLIKPAAFEKLFVPYYVKLFDMVHSFGAKTMMHSCGSIIDFIPIMIDMGLDILDVIQVDAANMDLNQLYSRYYKKIVFSGTISVQSILPHGTPEAIRSTIRKTRELFADGGLMLGPTNRMQLDMPTENFEAMLEAISEIY